MFNLVLNWISEYFQWNDSRRKFSLTLLKSLPVACALLPLSSSAAIKCSRNTQMLNISTRTGTIIFSNYLIISFKASCVLDEHALSGGQTQWLHQPGVQPDVVVLLVQAHLVVPGVQLGVLSLRTIWGGGRGKKVLTCGGCRICCWFYGVHFWSLKSKPNQKTH